MRVARGNRHSARCHYPLVRRILLASLQPSGVCWNEVLTKWRLQTAGEAQSLRTREEAA
jgi:hypothetical protein